MTSHALVSLLILVICLPAVSLFLTNSDSDSKSGNCGQHNGSCLDCISATQLNQSQFCYFCADSCLAVDYTSIFSNQHCYLNDFYVGQCDLNLLTLIILVVMALVCCCGSCVCVVIICCCCCCCQNRSSKHTSAPMTTYTRLINRDSFERQKMREERTRDIRDRYDL